VDPSVPSASWSTIVLWGILTFSLLVVVHEGGHFFAARVFGVRVHEFMIGLPGPAVRVRVGDTAYGVSMVPFGGYVRIAGMEPGPEDALLGPALKYAASRGRIDAVQLSNQLDIDVSRARSILTMLSDWGSVRPAEDDDSSWVVVPKADETTDAVALLDRERSLTYRGKKTWQRITMLAMGVVVNLVLALLVFTVVLSGFGVQQPSTTVDPEPASAAEAAGLMEGDRLLYIGDTAVEDWPAVLAAIGEYDIGSEVELTVERDGREVQLTAVMGEEQGQPRLGVATRFETMRMSVPEALAQSVQWIGLVFVAIASLLNPATFSATVQDVRGVVGISVEAASAAQRGALDYAWLVALLSLSLGVLNILPIPPLDGGKIAIEIVEKLRGRPLRRELILGISAAGAIMIFGLIGYLLYLDVLRYVVNA
jgi:regulator of sigma E protease